MTNKIEKQLFINSDINNLTFYEYDKYTHKVALLLPPLKPFIKLIDVINNDGEEGIKNNYSLLLQFNKFYTYLTNTLKQLEHHNYSFEYYFYIENRKEYHLSKVYTPDFNHKNYFNCVMGSYGYTEFLNIFDNFNPKELEHFYTDYAKHLTDRLQEILQNNNDNFDINFDKETLLVITKVNERNNKLNNNVDKVTDKIPGLNVNTIKRYYSTIHNKRYYSTKINVTKPINKVLHIAYNDYLNFGSDSYINLFKKNLSLGVKYSYIVKISKDNLYFTLSERQKFFLLDSTDMDDERFESFENYLHTNLSRILSLYNKVIDGDCDIITFNFFPINTATIEEFKIQNVEDINNKLSLKRSNQIKKEFSLFDINILKSKGIRLNLNVNKQEFNNDIEDLNYFKFYNVKNIDNNQYYYIKYRGKSYVITEYIKNNVIIKQCFDKLGAKLYSVEDTILDNGNIIRKDGNFYTHFNSNNEIINVQKNINFNTIYSKFKLNDKVHINQNIGTIDLETFKQDDISICYAIGYYTNENYNTYYIDKNNLNGYLVIHNCINELLRPKYNPYTFYCHNLGGFDAPFIIKALLEFNKSVDKSDRYTFDTFTRDNNIIRLTIKRRIDGKVRSLNIYDSLPILSLSLRKLCKAYKIQNSKTYFPYNFVNQNTLFYIGNTPDKSYYEISKTDSEFDNFYKTNYSNNWSLQKETIEYLILDLKSLYEVIKIVNLHMFLMFDIQMTESSTISGIAMRIFLNKFYKDLPVTDRLPLINSNQIYNDIYKAYYGGRVEVFIPKPINNEKLYYYDVNSLYPFASLNDLPGNDWTYNEFIKTPNLDNLFGFYYCKIESNGNYLGLLPFRKDNGGLLFPKGKWHGWYFSEELKLAAKYGYKIEVIKGYTTNKSKNVFNNFVNSIYKVKLNPKNNAEKNVAKLILNSLIGRFGMNPEKMVTKLLDRNEHNIISSSRVLKNSTMLDDDNYLDTFSTDINKEVCNEFGLDYTKVLNSKEFYIRKSKPIINSTISISTAASILSYSRIYMAKVMQYILSKGGRIYYTDTDSIVTNIELPNNIVDSKELGKFKLEHEIVEAYFISDKTYLIKNLQGDIIKKAKSVKEDSLDISDYIRFYNMEVYEGPIKTTAKRDYIKGSVNISSKKVTLNVDKYSKRERLFINNKWINSKPIWINNIDKFITIYKYIDQPLILYNNNKSLILYNNNKSLILYNNNKSLVVYNNNKSLVVYNNKSLVVYNNNKSLIAYNNKSLVVYNNKKSLIAYNNDKSLIVYNKCTKHQLILYNSHNITFITNFRKLYNIQKNMLLTHKYKYKNLICRFNFNLHSSASYTKSILKNILKQNLKYIHTKILNIISNFYIKQCYFFYLFNLNLIRLWYTLYTPTFIILLYILINSYRVTCTTSLLCNIVYFSENVWWELYSEISMSSINEPIDIIEDIDILYENIDILDNTDNYDTIITSIDCVNEPKLQTTTIMYIKSFILKHFKMLDFFDLNYYPSLFQRFTLPKVYTPIIYTSYIESVDVINYDTDIKNIKHNDDMSINSYTNKECVLRRHKILDFNLGLHTNLNANITEGAMSLTHKSNNEIPNYNKSITSVSLNSIEEDKNVIPLHVSNQINALNNKIITYKEVLAHRNVTIQLLMSEFDNLNDLTSKLLTNLNLNDNKVEDLECKIEEDSYKINELFQEISSLKSNKDTLCVELAELKNILEENNQTLDSKFNEIYSSNDKIVELNSKISFLNNIKLEYEELLASNDEELITYHNEKKMLTNKLEYYKHNASKLLDELNLEKLKSQEYLLWYDDTAEQLRQAKLEIYQLKSSQNMK